MIIRSEQMNAFSRAMLRAFEDEMVEHLAGFSPPLFKLVGAEQLRKAVRSGVARAGRYGIDCRGPLRLYLELMLLFGSSFDTDPQYPWATEILKDEDCASQMERAERIYEKTLDYLENVAGPDDAYAHKALGHISALAGQPASISWDNFVPLMLEEMARAHPQKKDYVGEDGLSLLIDKGIAASRRYGLSTARATTLFILLTFAFGHGCHEDPLHPWIAEALADNHVTDPEARGERWEVRALASLSHVRAHLDEEAKG